MLNNKKTDIKILFIHFRSYGDVMISLNALIPIKAISPDIRIDVVTNDSNAIFLYEKFLEPHKVYLTNYPFFLKEKHVSIINLIFFLKLIYQLRRNKYDYCLNLFSALRENLFGYFVKPIENIAPYWSSNHSFMNMIKHPNYLIKRKINIPVNKKNVYDIVNEIVKYFGGVENVHKYRVTLNENKIVGIHPFARERWRLWDFKKWNELIKFLNDRGFIVWIFCSKDELSSAQKYFHENINDQNSLHSDSLETFISKLSKVSLLIGLDSFSIHLASFLNVPRIMLNGANDHEIWAPPNTKVFSNGERCKFYPCYNKPRCIGSGFEFVCIKSIKVDEINSYLINKLTH